MYKKTSSLTIEEKNLPKGKPLMGAPILKYEIREAIKKTKGQSSWSWSNDIVIEIIQALDELGIEYMTRMANEIYDCG